MSRSNHVVSKSSQIYLNFLDNTFTVDNHDVEDIFSTAILALYESATLPENERILFAYSQVNKYVKSMKNVRENTKISLEDLTAKIYSGFEQDITDREKLASMQFDINQFIEKTKDKLNDKQASIFGAMMKGETISDIAKKEGVNKSSVCRIMARVKAIICKDILPQYPCIDIVNINAVLGVMAKINSQRHTKK